MWPRAVTGTQKAECVQRWQQPDPRGWEKHLSLRFSANDPRLNTKMAVMKTCFSSNGSCHLKYLHFGLNEEV